MTELDKCWSIGPGELKVCWSVPTPLLTVGWLVAVIDFDGWFVAYVDLLTVLCLIVGGGGGHLIIIIVIIITPPPPQPTLRNLDNPPWSILIKSPKTCMCTASDNLENISHFSSKDISSGQIILL